MSTGQQVLHGLDPQGSLPSGQKRTYIPISQYLTGFAVVMFVLYMGYMSLHRKDNFEPGPQEWNMGPLHPEVFADSGYEGLRQYEMADPGAYLANQSAVKENPSENLLWAQVHMM